MSETNWQKTPYGNLILKSDTVFISYNPDVSTNNSGGVGMLFNEMLDLDDNGGRKAEETALKIDDEWMILLGDFRKEYEQAFPDKEKCIAVFKSHKKSRSDWSTEAK